jgi:hypothetical protein
MTVSINTSTDQQVRLSVYEHLVEKGTAPTTHNLAGHLGMSREELNRSLHRLSSSHALVLTPDTTEIWMAHPFSAVPTPFPVKANGLTYYANCAWDALGIPALLQVDSITETACPDCQDSLKIGVTGDKLTGSGHVIHFAVPPRHFWDDVGFT